MPNQFTINTVFVCYICCSTNNLTLALQIQVLISGGLHVSTDFGLFLIRRYQSSVRRTAKGQLSIQRASEGNAAADEKVSGQSAENFDILNCREFVINCNESKLGEKPQKGSEMETRSTFSFYTFLCL